MVKIDIVTSVNVDGKPKITLTSSYDAEVEYTFNKALNKNQTCEIWVRAGTQDKLKLLTIRATSQAAAVGEEDGNWEPHYPNNNMCPALSFKSLHKLPNGECIHSDPIHLTEDRFFDPHTSDQLFATNSSVEEPELEAIVLTNNSNEDVGNIEVFVARDG